MKWEKWEVEESGEKSVKKELHARLEKGEYRATAVFDKNDFGILEREIEIVDEKTGKKYTKEIERVEAHFYKVRKGPSEEVYNLLVNVHYNTHSQPYSEMVIVAKVNKTEGGEIKDVKLIDHIFSTEKRFEQTENVPAGLIDMLEKAVYEKIKPKIEAAVREYSKKGENVIKTV